MALLRLWMQLQLERLERLVRLSALPLVRTIVTLPTALPSYHMQEHLHQAVYLPPPSLGPWRTCHPYAQVPPQASLPR